MINQSKIALDKNRSDKSLSNNLYVSLIIDKSKREGIYNDLKNVLVKKRHTLHVRFNSIFKVQVFVFANSKINIATV